MRDLRSVGTAGGSPRCFAERTEPMSLRFETGARVAKSGVFAGLCIGFTLTAIHIVGIQVTGVSVNPARSLGPALLVGGKALEQVWLFFVAPLAGAAVAGLVFRFAMPSSAPASA